MDSFGFERFWDQNVGHPVAACGGLKSPMRPVAPDWIPLILRFQILEAWCLDVWMLEGLDGIGGGDGGDGGMGGGDWKTFSHARASGAPRRTINSYKSYRVDENPFKVNTTHGNTDKS